jgi:neutral ceramidase
MSGNTWRMTETWNVGRGVADITGEPWGVGMMGYGMPEQRTYGILSRQYARAFAFEAGDSRIVYVVADIGMFFHTAVAEIHARLASRFGETYSPRNVVLTATHTHCGPGGHGTDILYNITTAGFHSKTFERLVSGVVEAIVAAHADVQPTDVTLARGELHNASANRAREAFEQNSIEEKSLYPEAIDQNTLLMKFTRGERFVGAIHWFAVHNTSMMNSNRFISSDNKGMAAWLWEHEHSPGDVITAFAQTNAGDQSPNLDLKPGKGPTDDERKNTRIIAERQLASAQELANTATESLPVGVASVATNVSMAKRHVGQHRTGRGVLGASFAAGKMTDGPGSPLFREGKNNRFLAAVTGLIYRLRPGTRAAHSPKDFFLPVGPLRWVQEKFPVQLVRLGSLHLVCLPFEVTLIAGLRIRRAVAAELGLDVADVVVQAYANGYGHYVTTPEEYDVQLYEGGSTIFGRHELAAITEISRDLARALAGRIEFPATSPQKPGMRLQSPLGSPRWGRRGRINVISAPQRARVGETVSVVFGADHPNAKIRPTYLEVSRGGIVIAGDDHPDTSIRWRRSRSGRFNAEVTWVADAPGEVTISYVGRKTATATVTVV